MVKIQTLLFDLDGTLIDSRADLVSAVNWALESVGLPRKEAANIVPHVGNGMRTLLGNVFGPVKPELLDRGIETFAEYYDDHCVDQTTLYGNVLDVISSLQKKVKIGVVTNKPHGFSEKILKTLRLAPFISVIVGGDTLPERKPDPAPVLHAVKALGAHIESTMMIGDGIQDIQAGKAAGTRTCAARYGYGFQPDILKFSPDFVIDNFLEIKEIAS